MSELKFKPVPYDIVTSASTGKMTVRGTDANAPYNSNLLNRLQAVADSGYDGNLFDDGVDFGSCTADDLQKLLTQVVIRFDNDPNYYTKRDYQYLIWYLCKSLITLSDSNDKIGELQRNKQDKVDTSIKFEDGSVVNALNFLYDLTQSYSVESYNQIFTLDLPAGVKTVYVNTIPNIVFVQEQNTPLFLISNEGAAFSKENTWEWLKWGSIATKSDIKKVQTEIEGIYGDIDSIQQDLNGAYRDISRIQTDIAELKEFDEGVKQTITTIVRNYQTKEDIHLRTTDKTVVGAINELQAAIQPWLLHDGRINQEIFQGDVPKQVQLTDSLPAGKYIVSADNTTCIQPFTNSCVVVQEGDKKIVYSWGSEITVTQSATLLVFLADPEFAESYYNDYDSVSEVYYTESGVWTINNIWVQQSAGNGKEYTEGTSIDIKDDVISAVVDSDINVSFPIGGFEQPVTISKGTDLTKVLKQLLEVVIGVTAVNPTVKLSGTSLTKEYGTVIEEQPLKVVLTQGYFKPSDTRWDGPNQSMNCELDNAELSTGQGAEIIDQSEDKLNVEGYFIIPQHTLTKEEKYTLINNYVTANTVNPVNSNGDFTNEKGFKGGVVSSSGTVTYTPYYNAFIGGTNVTTIVGLASADVRSLTPYQLSVTPTTKTLLDGQATFNDGKNSILIACPKGYKLVSVQTELGTDMTDSFDLKGVVDVQCGELTVQYNCYMCVVYGNCGFQTVKLGKE